MVYRAITKLATSEIREVQELPVETEDMTDDQREVLPDLIERVKVENE